MATQSPVWPKAGVEILDAHEVTLPDAQQRYQELAIRDLMSRAIADGKANTEKVSAGDYPPLTVAEHLEALALGEFLARYYRSPGRVHRALLAGATFEQVAVATETSEAKARAAYLQWADEGHRLGGKFGMSDADHAAAVDRARPEADRQRPSAG